MKTRLLIAISVQNPFDNATPISGFHCTLNRRNRIDQIFKIEVYLHIDHGSKQHGHMQLWPRRSLLRLTDRYYIAENWKDNTQVRTYTHTHARTHARTHACAHARTHERTQAHKHSDRMNMKNTSSDTTQNIAWEISNAE